MKNLQISLCVFVIIKKSTILNRAGKKNLNLKNITEPNSIRKSSTKSEPKLVKYLNGCKILVQRKTKPNPTRTEVFWVSELRIYPKYIYILKYINIFLDLDIKI